MGLTPRQPSDSSKHDWDYLDKLLKVSLKQEHRDVSIRISEYSMPEHEIISEAERCGYTVSKSENGLYLRFK